MCTYLTLISGNGSNNIKSLKLFCEEKTQIFHLIVENWPTMQEVPMLNLQGGKT